jgi:lipopolysaccharide/colanic/teichoic acid biosynthesis glycosyltransferase
VPVLDVADRPISDWNLVFKWLFDKIVALVAIILLSPVMIGDGHRHQARQQGPDHLQAEAARLQQRADRGLQVPLDVHRPVRRHAAKLVTKGDPRVTKVGRFIRKTSIDELPQFFNVLQGRAVARRPAPACAAGQGRQPALLRGGRRLFRPPPRQARRHRLGADQRLARRDRHDDKIMQRVNHDLYYIENWSIFLDLYILFMTPRVLDLLRRVRHQRALSL